MARMWPGDEATLELLAQARQGDAGAVNRLLDRHRAAIRRMVELRLDRRLQGRLDVSDVVQDALLEAHRRLKDYLANPPLPFHLWLRHIAHDRLIDAHRRHRGSARRSVDREQPAAVVIDQSTLDLVAQLRDSQLTPGAVAAQRELAAVIEAAVARLPEQDREMVLMRHFEQLTNQEVARALNIAEPAASMRYLRAMRRLKGLLGEGATQGFNS